MNQTNNDVKPIESTDLLGCFKCATCGKPIGEQGVIHKSRAMGKSFTLCGPSEIFCSSACHNVAYPINLPNSPKNEH